MPNTTLAGGLSSVLKYRIDGFTASGLTINQLSYVLK